MDVQFELQKKVGIYYYRFKDGESGSDVHARVCIFLQNIIRRLLSNDSKKWDNIIIVSHCLTIKYILMNLLNMPVRDYDNLKDPNNAEFWVFEKNQNGHYDIKSDIFFENKDSYFSIHII